MARTFEPAFHWPIVNRNLLSPDNAVIGKVEARPRGAQFVD